MATIRIVDLKLRGIIGTHPWERKNKQDILLNVLIEYDASKAGRSDNLKDALDYEHMANQLTKKVENSRFRLLERLGAELLSCVLADKRVLLASITLQKPHALAAARFISYEISGKN